MSPTPLADPRFLNVDPEVTWSHRDLRFYPVDPKVTWNNSIWNGLVEDVLAAHYRAMIARSQSHAGEDLAPLTISKIMWDAKKGCGILKTHEGTEAGPVRDLLMAHMDVTPALRIVIKADCVRYIVRAFLPKGRSAARITDLEANLKAVNPLLRRNFFRCVQTMTNDKGSAFYFETTLEVVQWLRKRNCVAQAASRGVEFTIRPYFVTVDNQDEDVEDGASNDPPQDIGKLQPYQLPHIPLPKHTAAKE